jgi:hypothetical protein
MASGEKIASIAKWFFKCMAEESQMQRAEWNDLSPVETQLWESIAESFGKWLEDYELH